MTKGNYQKWEEYSREYKVDKRRLLTFRFTVENTVNFLRDKIKDKLLVLDIGCGAGLIDILLATKTRWQLCAIDISTTILEQAKKNIEIAGIWERIKIERGDVYQLTYFNKQFDIVLSFGYGSAASYPGVQKEVSRVLKDDGILILDFVNHFSFYNLAGYHFKSTYRALKSYWAGTGKNYHFGILGIKKYYDKEGFKLLKKAYFNAFPPVFYNFLPEWLYVFFEKTAGKLLGPILGRTILIMFQKK